MRIIFPWNPSQALDDYLQCDEWHLYSEVRSWPGDCDLKKRKLGQEWAKLYGREVKWKMSYSTEISIDQIQRGTRFAHAGDYERQLREFLPKKLRGISFRVDLATQDPRPINPMAETEKRVNIFNPATGMTSPEPLKDIYRFIPARIVHLRVFSLSHDHDAEISEAADKMLNALEGTVKTNI
jgi:hypothetical protein